MQTKLTLRLDKHIIGNAKLYARRRNKSLSQIVEEYFLLLTNPTESLPEAVDDELPPITRSLLGILHDEAIGEEDYRRYLEQKHQ
mgnify:CR=1 FL=1